MPSTDLDRAVLAAAVEVAEAHGLDVSEAGGVVDGEGQPFPLSLFVDMVLARVAVTEEPPPANRSNAFRAIARLTRLRQQVGTRLIAAAEQVYEDALRQAGAKFNTRARSRTSASRQREVIAAIEARAPLRPYMAVVGVKEDELLRGVFDTFRRRALNELQQYRNAVVAVVSDLAPDDRPLIDITTEAESAVEFLIAGLTAMVRSRLLDGEAHALQAVTQSVREILEKARARVGPKAKMVGPRPRPPTGGDILPGLPNPDELARASARLVRNALDVHEGRATWQFPTTPDQMPNIAFIEGAAPVEEQLAISVGVQPVWTWEHGFYGEPPSPLEGHDSLHGFTTNDRSSFDNPGDPDLANSEGWPSYGWYFPDDHDGCTCEWVIDVGDSEEELSAGTNVNEGQTIDKTPPEPER